MNLFKCIGKSGGYCPISTESSWLSKVNNKKVGGGAALITAVAMLAMAAVLASGIFGGGAMFFVAASLVAISIVPFCIAAFTLCPPMKYSSMGSPADAKKSE